MTWGRKLRPLGEGLLFWLCKGGFKVSSGILGWYKKSFGTDFDNSELVSTAWVEKDLLTEQALLLASHCRGFRS